MIVQGMCGAHRPVLSCRPVLGHPLLGSFVTAVLPCDCYSSWQQPTDGIAYVVEFSLRVRSRDIKSLALSDECVCSCSVISSSA